MITREIDKPRESYIQIRGDFLRKGAPVEPAVPAVLGRVASTGETGTEQGRQANRLALAQWLVSTDNPMTARVMANRYWTRFFGRGLVETENDFGTQGDRPTHPELLDWLANEFRGSGASSTQSLFGSQREDQVSAEPSSTNTVKLHQQELRPPLLDDSPHRPAWDLKKLHRQIVSSATYRQTSHARPDLTEHDPVNKLLARQSRIRVDAEMIRDAALTVSGLLTEEVGGPPVYPPQPDGVFDFTQDKKPWKTSTGPDRYRKGLYTHLWRSSLYPSMAAFDFPDPNVTCTRRIRSNTPLQSLTLANDETFAEFATEFAVRLLGDAVADDSQRLSLAVETSLGREPSSSELARLRGFLQQQRDRFANDVAAAKSFAPKSIPQSVSPAEAAAWTAVSRVLMNLDEFITRE